MDTVNADVHQGSVGKRRMESVFDDPLFEMVIAAGIFTERKIYLPDCSKHRQQGTDRCKTRRKDRAHGFEQNDLIFYGSVIHLLKFRSIGGDWFSQSTCLWCCIIRMLWAAWQKLGLAM